MSMVEGVIQIPKSNQLIGWDLRPDICSLAAISKDCKCDLLSFIEMDKLERATPVTPVEPDCRMSSDPVSN